MPDMARFSVTARDGTRIRAWTNDAEGPPLLVCNGLGTNPWAWPALHDPACGFAAATWWHRGTGGSERPADPSRVTVRDHADDAAALLDALDVERALVAAWSMGVTVAAELLSRHPDRVTGLLAVAGVPGDSFAAMLPPVPGRWREPVATALARGLHAAGPALSPVASALGRWAMVPRVVRHTGFMLPLAHPGFTELAVRDFLQVDVRWYAQLALVARDHVPVELSAVRVPVAYLAGRWDVLTSPDSVAAAARRTPDARVDVLPGSHFLPLELPARVHDHLIALAGRAGVAGMVA
jgi:pimeloyl-ACP methyl ester carboxylesterase